MNQELLDTLDALYRLEEDRLRLSDYDFWLTPGEIAMALPTDHDHHGDAFWTRQQLERLWVARKVLQLPENGPAEHHLVDVELLGLDRHGAESGKLRIERNDCRGALKSEFEQVALYAERVPVRFRSRVAEVGRLLSSNYQRFKMARATGVLRYERRPQRRPDRNLLVSELSVQWATTIRSGQLRIETAEHTVDCQLRSTVDRQQLQRATTVVLQALSEQPRPGIDRLAPFQAASVLATLAGIYSDDYREKFDAHVITAGVGSGKSFAFQIGALIHSAYTLLTGQRGVRILLLYPRVALAANQFQDLFVLVQRVGELLNIKVQHPVLDAGGQLPSQMGLGAEDPGKLYNAIRAAYGSGDYLIAISNLDTLANRLNHPEASRALTNQLDLVVFDEIHLLNGLYGSHAKMLLKRLTLLRAMWRLREAEPTAPFSALLERHREMGNLYVVGASATIAEPNRHTARLIGCEEGRILRVDVETPQETGWVHHFFLRQKPEVSTMTALVNATSCLVHNRRDGLFREYYQQKTEDPTPRALSLDDLNNPIQAPPATLIPRSPDHIHKTLGFCDSLDGVGRWADLVADNEGTKQSGTVDANPQGNYPYFIRFQEPLWRVVHHLSFARQPQKWLGNLRTHYGDVCRNCKLGVRCSAKRVPDGLNQAGRRKVDELWDFTPTNPESYLQRIGVAEEFIASHWYQPFREAAQSEMISNLDGCPFFKTGLCWWWSIDHAGSNAPAPADRTTPLNGIKMAGQRPDFQHHFVNALRLKSFTSQTEFDVLKISTINEVYRDQARRLFRDRNYQTDQLENAGLVIGSPRLEVGVDLSRVTDGITYRAMRDPSSLQQKVGRVGREIHSDSVLLHLVTQNARDQYYFRNPRIALDPDYLQALPLHEDNRIVARHHFFMGIVDFLCLQGTEPGERKIADYGDRLMLINDHLFNPSFSGWDLKVRAVHEYLFGAHPNRDENRRNLVSYLRLLGARTSDITNLNAAAELTPANAPMTGNLGALDVFEHEFGPNFLLTPLTLPRGGIATLAQICATRFEPPMNVTPGFPRHEEFLKTFDSPNADEGRNPFRDRSYLRNLLELSLFRRGIPALNMPGDYPFIWTPNLFESAGTEIVRVFEFRDGRPKELGYESVSIAAALLAPGTVTYRYGNSPRKVPVSSQHAIGQPSEISRGVQEVRLATGSPEFFEPAAGCGDIQQADLPAEFLGNAPIRIYTPRQVPLISSASEPLVTRGEGLMADGDSRPVPQVGQTPPPIRLMTPPRCYPLQWFRMEPNVPEPVVPRFQQRLSQYALGPVPNFPFPNVFSLFSSIRYDPSLGVTDFVWGLDRQFMSREVTPARLVYRGVVEGGTATPIAIGNSFAAPGLIFSLSTSESSPIGHFIDEVFAHPESVVYQTVVLQVLTKFLAEFARAPRNPGDPPWIASARPSIFTVRNIKSVVLFHLLRRWHPPADSGSKPSAPPIFTMADIVGCFDPAHSNYVDQTQFDRYCDLIAEIHDPPSVPRHSDTLKQTRANFDQATGQLPKFNADFFRTKARDLLLNSISLAMHQAALRLSGAEEANLGYFYKEHEGSANIFLFDTDAFGNGTAELIRDNLYVPAAERALVERLRVLGNQVDPLPSLDFARALEEELQECESGHAAHLAYHGILPSDGCWQHLANEYQGERNRAGALYDFIHLEMQLGSFDYLAALQECPEFVAYASAQYPCYGGKSLVGSSDFPAYQALESAFGFCQSSCISCLLSPEMNIHGSLTAKDTANKLLLDACYRSLVCEADDSAGRNCYPANGPGRSVEWGKQGLVCASALAQETGGPSFELHLPTRDGSNQALLISPALTVGAFEKVFRVGWEPLLVPTQRVRVRMEL